DRVGLVASLNRPGGNVTGISLLSWPLTPKRLELLRELVPKATIVGVLVNPKAANAELESRETQLAAVAVGQQIRVLGAATESELRTVFASVARNRRARHRRRCIFRQPTRFDSRARGTARGSRDLRIRRSRRFGELRSERNRCVPPGRHLRWPHPQRREAGRLAGPAAHEI